MTGPPTPHHESALVASVRARIDAAPQPSSDIAAEVKAAALHLAPLLEPGERERLERRVHSDIVGLGPLDDLLAADDVQEVMVTGGRDVWVDVGGRLRPAGRLPAGMADVVLERILSPLGRRLDRRSPTVDARLPDGSRVCAVIAPVCPDGPTISIRRFAVHTIALDRFASPAVVDLLTDVVHHRCNVVVSGATSSGKTTLLNALTTVLDPHERVITLEDTAELRLAGDHVVRLEARDATADGVGAIGLDHLLRTALRLRPDRLVVGEVRGPEALTLLQAMGTGHDGSLATLHANDANDTLRRLEGLVVQGAPSWPLSAVREQVHASLDVVVHVGRGPDGSRRVCEVAELTGPGEEGRLRALATGEHVTGELSRRRHGG